MISCTEFIPSYSQLFTYLETEHGRDEVDRFWEYLFDPYHSPLFTFLEADGIRGCWNYWKGSLMGFNRHADFIIMIFL